MLMMIEKGIRDGICHAIHRYSKAINKYMKNYNKNKESSYIQYVDANNLYGKGMFQKLPLNGFNWKKMYLNLIKKFIKKNYDEYSNKGYILEIDVEYPKYLHSLHRNLQSYQKEWKLKNAIRLYAICMIKKNMLFM